MEAIAQLNPHNGPTLGVTPTSKVSGGEIQPVALYTAVAERLRLSIFAHELKPGQWIDEQALAQQFGISRTPMREALKVLASEGLVQLKPRRGCYVTEISERDLDEIFPLMAMLEAQAVREACARLTPDDLERLKGLHQQLEEAFAAHDLNRFFVINESFHREIQGISTNRWLMQIIADLRKVMKLRRRDSLDKKGRVEQSLLEHREILRALLDRNAESAAAQMQQHLQAGREAARSQGV